LQKKQNLKDFGSRAVADPDLQIREGPGHPDPEIREGPVSKKNFPAPRPLPWIRHCKGPTMTTTGGFRGRGGGAVRSPINISVR